MIELEFSFEDIEQWLSEASEYHNINSRYNSHKLKSFFIIENEDAPNELFFSIKCKEKDCEFSYDMIFDGEIVP